MINKVFNLDVFEYLNLVPDNSVDLVIADPPYNIGIDKWDKYSDEDYWEFTFRWLDKMISKLKDNGSFYLFNNAYNSALIVAYLHSKDVKFQNSIIWYKKDGFSPSKSKFVNNQETILFYTKGKKSNNHVFNYNNIRVPYESQSRMKHAAVKGILKNGKRWYPNPNGKLCTDVWEFSSHRHKTKINGIVTESKHPTPKPEDLIARIIEASTDSGDLVMDLFSGSGTTSYVAKKLSRNYTGCELEKSYMDLITTRLKSITE